MNTTQKKFFIGMMTVVAFAAPAFAVAMVENSRKTSAALAGDSDSQIQELSDQMVEHQDALVSLQSQYDASLKKQEDAYNTALDEVKQQYEQIIADQNKRLQDASSGTNATLAPAPKTVTVPKIQAQPLTVTPVVEKKTQKKTKPKSSSSSKSS